MYLSRQVFVSRQGKYRTSQVSRIFDEDPQIIKTWLVAFQISHPMIMMIEKWPHFLIVCYQKWSLEGQQQHVYITIYGRLQSTDYSNNQQLVVWKQRCAREKKNVAIIDYFPNGRQDLSCLCYLCHIQSQSSFGANS